jgi:drug/metabolite transporter (DMT)-like permease
VIFAAFTEGLPRELQLVGFGLALVGIWLLSRPERMGGRPQGLEMAVLAGTGFAGFFIALDQVSESAVFWPLVAGRVSACGVMVVFALVKGQPITLLHAPLRLLTVVGVFDAAGNLFFLLALQTGRLDVVAVLGSLYPAVTAILARLVIKERMTRLQVIGVSAAVLAIVLITL